jgi:hypothetical protein
MAIQFPFEADEAASPRPALEDPWAQLWERETRALNQELLVSGDRESYVKYREAICRGKNQHFHCRLSKAKAVNGPVVIEHGVFKSLKFWINSTAQPWLEIFEDSLLFYAASHSDAVARAKERQEVVFAHIFITSPAPACDLALGLYAVGEFLGGPRSCWRLLRVDDATSAGALLPVAEASPGSETSQEAEAAAEAPLRAAALQDSMGSSSSGPHAAPPAARPPPPVPPAASAGPQQPRSSARAPPPGALQSRRFCHDGDAFDSQLECVHREAFKRMGLRFTLSRNSFQVSQALRTKVQQIYTPDGVLHAPLHSPEAPLSILHVEIKPGRLTVQEADLCFALCQTMQQHVLCISGGYVTDSILAVLLQESRAAGAPGAEYSCLPRPLPFMEMSLYEPRGIGALPFYYPSVSWVGTGARVPDYYLSVCEPADPLEREQETLRLARTYHLATKDAQRMSRGQQEPY